MSNKAESDKDDEYVLRICEMLMRFSRLSAKKRARIMSNLDEIFALDDLKQGRAEDFEFIFNIYNEAQNVLNPDSVLDDRIALIFIANKIRERYPNIKSVYDSRRAARKIEEEKPDWMKKEGGQENG